MDFPGRARCRRGGGGGGCSPAPTGPNVGATLAVAPGAVAETNRTWVIPQPTAVNLAPTLGDVIGSFKSLVFKVYLDWIEANDPTRRAKFWQRNYYEHVIRNETELYAIRVIFGKTLCGGRWTRITHRICRNIRFQPRWRNT